MLKHITEQFQELVKGRSKAWGFGVFLAAGALTGLASVLFMRAFELVLKYQLDASRIGMWRWIVTPLLFVLAVELIRRIAPCADGAGIPQTVFAATHLSEASIHRIYPLVSLRTMFVKVIALLLGVWAGASTGREGPTVHVAACLFLGVILLVQRVTKLKLDLRSTVIAGGAAGLAAAFNTPLAGVTFAIEELSANYFSSIKESVLMAIILAGIAAQTLTGEYSYFGRLLAPAPVSMTTVVLIGFICGLCGAFFSMMLIRGRELILASQKGFWRYAIPVFFALGLLGLNEISTVSVLGPGNKFAQLLLNGGVKHADYAFPVLKLFATLFTYWSGIAGGIFAPSLSIGAGLGAAIGSLFGDAATACALIGMAAFLAATIQAPMTAFVVIFEMTGHHKLLLPIMLASLIAVITARALGAKHLYQALADSYGKMLGFQAAGSATHSP